MASLLCGVAINDAGYEVSPCKFYGTWKRMVERCYAPSMLKRNPTYAGDTVCTEWLTFSNFKAWMEMQPWEGMEIDKDLLVSGNTVYSPETSCFVPKKINLLLSTSDGKRGNFALGVCMHSQSRHKYQARSKVYIGLFDTEQSAHNAWQKQKAIDLFDAIIDWQFDPKLNHTFNQRVACNILKVSDKLTEDRLLNNETKSLKI